MKPAGSCGTGFGAGSAAIAAPITLINPTVPIDLVLKVFMIVSRCGL